MNLTNIPNFSWGFCHASRMFIFDKDLATNVASLWCFQTFTMLCKVLTLLRRGCLSITILNKILASAFTLQVWLLLVWTNCQFADILLLKIRFKTLKKEYVFFKIIWTLLEVSCLRQAELDLGLSYCLHLPRRYEN